MNLRFPDGSSNAYEGTGGGVLANATEEHLIDALAALERGELEYIILEDDGGKAFLQAAGDAKTGYTLEYNDGSDKHQYRATNTRLSGGEIADAFTAYLNHDPSWRTNLTWEKFSF